MRITSDEFFQRAAKQRRGPSKPGRLIALKFEGGVTQTLTMPFRLGSRANRRGHTRSREHTKPIREQRSLTHMFLDLHARRVRPPVQVHCVRIAPRKLDKNENLPVAFKAIVDGIADWLGIDDRTGIECTYAQERAPTPHTYGCRIEIRPLR